MISRTESLRSLLVDRISPGTMKERLFANDHRFNTLIDAIITRKLFISVSFVVHAKP